MEILKYCIRNVSIFIIMNLFTEILLCYPYMKPSLSLCISVGTRFVYVGCSKMP